MSGSGWLTILKETGLGWWEDKAPRLGAALAYYTVLSLAPLVILVAPIAGMVSGLLFGPEAGERQITEQFTQLFGPEAGPVIDVMLHASDERAAPGRLATALSLAVLLFAASGVFAELQDALDTIWEVVPRPGNKAALLSLVRQRFLSFAMVLVICFLLLVSLVLSAALASLQAYAERRLQTDARVWLTTNGLISFVVITFLFALIFKVLPDVKLRWRDVMLGAALTSALFALGRYVIGQYLGRTTLWSNYGAGKSLVVLLVWIYYSAQILFLGAEFTKAYTRRTAGPVAPTEVAVPITEEARAQQGIAHAEVVEAVAEVVERKKVEAEDADDAGDGPDAGGASAGAGKVLPDDIQPPVG
jgi:membrane protein